MANKNIIVARIAPNHPGGRFRRSGLEFTPTPRAYDLGELKTEELRQAVLDDKTIIKIEKGEVYKQAIAAFNGKPIVGTEHVVTRKDLKDNPSLADDGVKVGDTITLPPEGEDEGEGNTGGDQSGEGTEGGQGGEGDEGTAGGIPHVSKITKAQIVEELEKRGMKAGEDFDPEAKKDDLYALLTA